MLRVLETHLVHRGMFLRFWPLFLFFSFVLVRKLSWRKTRWSYQVVLLSGAQGDTVISPVVCALGHHPSYLRVIHKGLVKLFTYLFLFNLELEEWGCWCILCYTCLFPPNFINLMSSKQMCYHSVICLQVLLQILIFKNISNHVYSHKYWNLSPIIVTIYWIEFGCYSVCLTQCMVHSGH